VETPDTVSARSLRDPQKRPPQKSPIGIVFCGERIGNSAPIERLSYDDPENATNQEPGALALIALKI
jgi:hypothetical protein